MNVSNICSEASGILQFVGWILTVFKIAIPLIILALGMFDFGKAVIAAKDDEIKKSAKSLLMRAIAGVIIFFVPTIVLWVFSGIKGYSEAAEQGDFNICKTCLLTPWDEKCADKANK